MKNISFLIVGMVALLSFNSCTEEDPDDVTIEFAGKWKLTEVNFIDENVEPWHEDTEATSGNLLGWAPYMYSEIIGYELSNSDHSDEEGVLLGKKSVVAINLDIDEYGDTYWVWNEIEENKSFEITQISSFIPYDFSLTETSDLKVSKKEGKDVLEFTTTVTSVNQDDIKKIPAPMLRPKIQVEVRLTLVRMNADEEYVKGEYNPVIKLNGEPFQLPTDAEFVGKWKLKEVNFIDENVEPWHEDTEATSGNLLGWAPYMYSEIIGYELRTSEHYDKNSKLLGKRSVVAINLDIDEYGDTYWVWNEIKENKSFEITQISSFIPYDFSLTETSDLKVSKKEGKEVLEFTTTVTSVNQDDIKTIPAPMLRPKIQVKARITIERMGAEDEYVKGEYNPVIKLNGEPFELPEEVKSQQRP